MTGEPPRATTVLYVAWAPFFSGAERALMIFLENLDPWRYRPVVALGTRGELEAELSARGIATAHVPITYTGLRYVAAWIGMSAISSACPQGTRSARPRQRRSELSARRVCGTVARLSRRHPCPVPGFRDRIQMVSEAGLSARPLRVWRPEGRRRPRGTGSFADRSEVVYDGVRVQEAPDDPARRALRQELELPPMALSWRSPARSRR